MKLTRKQVTAIIAHTPQELKGKQDHLTEELGYYQPSGVNWSYRAGWTYEGNLVVLYFGVIL